MIHPCNVVAKDLVNTLNPYAKNGLVVPKLKLEIYNFSIQGNVVNKFIYKCMYFEKSKYLR